MLWDAHDITVSQEHTPMPLKVMCSIGEITINNSLIFVAKLFFLIRPAKGATIM